MRALSIVFAMALLWTGAATRAEAQSPARAWVEMVQGGAEARAVTTAAQCPTLEVDGQPVPMRTRAAPDPAFPVTVCEARLPAQARRAVLDGSALPLLSGPPQRILVFGDTGCRVKDSEVQNCNDARLWPFAQVARLAAAHHPDLVIHVGDYYYRETPCPSNYAGCAGSPYGDAWATWRAEFFDPAAPLLNAAPWVFVRGNHESCARGGRGWFRLLDAAPLPLACPAASAPFSVDLGGLKLYVLDSADAGDVRAPADSVAEFSGQLDALAPDLSHGQGWILTHRPFWGLAPLVRMGAIGPLEGPINRTEQKAAQGHDLNGVQMVVSGHIHHFASLSFGPQRPAQLIAGTGGDIGSPWDLSRVRQQTVTIDGMDAQRLTFDRFGYFLLDREGEDWVGSFRTLDDRVIAVCRLHERALACAPRRP